MSSPLTLPRKEARRPMGKLRPWNPLISLGKNSVNGQHWTKPGIVIQFSNIFGNIKTHNKTSSFLFRLEFNRTLVFAILLVPNQSETPKVYWLALVYRFSGISRLQMLPLSLNGMEVHKFTASHWCTWVKRNTMYIKNFFSRPKVISMFCSKNCTNPFMYFTCTTMNYLVHVSGTKHWNDLSERLLFSAMSFTQI